MKKAIFYLLLSVFFFSCSNTDEYAEPIKSDTPKSGVLKFIYDDIYYSSNYDTKNGILNIEDKAVGDIYFDLLKHDEINILIDSNGVQEIVIDNSILKKKIEQIDISLKYEAVGPVPVSVLLFAPTNFGGNAYIFQYPDARQGGFSVFDLSEYQGEFEWQASGGISKRINSLKFISNQKSVLRVYSGIRFGGRNLSFYMVYPRPSDKLWIFEVPDLSLYGFANTMQSFRATPY